MQNVFPWLKDSSPGNLLLETATLKIWSLQAAIQFFTTPPSIISLTCPKNFFYFMLLFELPCALWLPSLLYISIKQLSESPKQLSLLSFKSPGIQEHLECAACIEASRRQFDILYLNSSRFLVSRSRRSRDSRSHNVCMYVCLSVCLYVTNIN